MALDSAAKRQAVPGAGRPYMRGQLPAAAAGREWRSSAGLSYPVSDFQTPTVPAPVTGISGGSPDVHAIRRRAWARINRRAGKVEQEDVNVILQTIEDDELIGIIQTFLTKV